jgi:4-hydroxy-tetrahydrodipicolinate reductase
MTAKRYSVVQWCTGNVGARALRRVIEHPDLDLVGVYVHSTNKVGTDAGACWRAARTSSPRGRNIRIRR